MSDELVIVTNTGVIYCKKDEVVAKQTGSSCYKCPLRALCRWAP
jgi:CRISPR/Cas system-associated exonuclease Cas4 (RecB family)